MPRNPLARVPSQSWTAHQSSLPGSVEAEDLRQRLIAGPVLTALVPPAAERRRQARRHVRVVFERPGHRLLQGRGLGVKPGPGGHVGCRQQPRSGFLSDRQRESGQRPGSLLALAGLG